ncbi:30S ribosomal protein S12 methylthiotransferase RimO [Dethiobacter alkaliphilus]|uniref:Ribosomal protein uS12 methylthiotransferase RimO n=1 Tax=Dethiobacter alkaliphilus AHT 1 TaxID=555088 RepID=C0GKG0_DETAL|nr:30S ribosomal protein S12 methylthiotransferase RimO [Dethiobacter alkaliphilus]EEG76203.1 MiaB-like tRNA modifying enzyme YliG [Dethiobacter alkaliphilus AHT 1]
MQEIKVAVVSLGCAKNLVDSETMLGLLNEDGFTLTTDPEKAHVIIINTCGFIDAAKEESIAKILEMAAYKEKNCRLLLAAGCMAQRFADELLDELPEVDGLFGTNDVHGAAVAIRRGLAGEKVSFTQGEFAGSDDAPRLLSTPSHTAYLKIAEGCDNRCTYCAIPAIRGPYQSRDGQAVVSEAQSLAAGGVKELNLIAQDITLYGTDRTGKAQLPKLLGELAAIDGVHWIRLLYAYPERLDQRIIEAVAREEKVCKYLDLPLQHGSDKILRRMGRKTTADKILKLIETLRREVPGIVLRSSFIAGFPGEGEEEFGEMLAFLKEAQLDRVGFFAYSREEGTPAAAYSNQVPAEVKEERVRRAVALQSAISEKKQQQLVGKTVTAMVDGSSAQDPSILLARSYMQAPEVDGYIRIQNSDKKAQKGGLLPVTITGFDGYDLLA